MTIGMYRGIARLAAVALMGLAAAACGDDKSHAETVHDDCYRMCAKIRQCTGDSVAGCYDSCDTVYEQLEYVILTPQEERCLDAFHAYAKCAAALTCEAVSETPCVREDAAVNREC